MADATGISFGTHPSLLPTPAPASNLDPGRLSLANALSRLDNVESLSELNGLISSLDVTARPGPYVLYTGDFPDLPGADGLPTRTGTIANQVAAQIGASIIDETPRAQFLADPAVVSKFTDLATQAGLDPAQAYSEHFFTNPDAYWREASREFVGSTNGDGFAVTGSRTRTNPIMVVDEIPTALSTPGSNFLPARDPGVADAIATGDESAIRQALANSTRDLINDGHLLRAPDDAFGITRDGLDRLGLGATPEPVPMASDLRSIGYQPLMTTSPDAQPLAPMADSSVLPGSTHPLLGGLTETPATLPDLASTEVPSISPAQLSSTAPEITGLEPVSPGAPETAAPLSDPLAGSPTGAPEIGAPDAPTEITGTATGRFTPSFVGVIGQSPTASKIFTGAGILGAAGLAADAGLTGYNAYQLYNQGDTLGAGHEVAGFGGRLGGSLTGAYLLGEAGALGGPWGALGGAVVGGIGGAILGDKGVKSLYDSLTGYQPPAAAAAPTPAWPDQFASEFDLANGGGPFSDPMTGYQPESQADYDARRQAYVDSKMADQQTQGQQLMDSLQLMPGVDPNALPADPTANPPPAAPAAPAPDAMPAPPDTTSSSVAPLDANPAATDGITPTPTGFDGNPAGATVVPPAPLSLDSTSPSLDGGANTSIGLGSLDGGLNASLGLNSSLGLNASPAIGSTPDLTSSAPLGLDPGLGSGLDIGLNSGLNSGFNTGLDSGLNPSFDSSVNSNLDNSFNSSVSSNFSSNVGSGFNSGLDSSFSSSPGSGFNSGLDSSLNSGLDSSFGSSLDSGTGSSGFNDFGDSSLGGSSLGGDSFSSGSFGGEMGPVVLDLAGKGIAITGLSDSHAAFDADGNGVPNPIAWTTPEEGLLAFDANGSGTVDQTRELALREWTPGAQTDLQGLRAFDTNHDGALDAPDRDFSRFGVWRDANGNGVSDPGELNSLVEAGVSAISLTSDGLQSHLPDGSTIYGQGSFTRTDGSSGRLADVALAYAPDINAARDQLVGAMAAGSLGSAGATVPTTPAAAMIGPTLGADVVSPLHPRAA